MKRILIRKRAIS